jgi:hypothetical protein
MTEDPIAKVFRGSKPVAKTTEKIAEGPLMPSVPRPGDIRAINAPVDSVLRRDITFTRPQATTGSDTVKQIDPYMTNRVVFNTPFGAIGALPFSSTEIRPEQQQRGPALNGTGQLSPAAVPTRPIDPNRGYSMSYGQFLAPTGQASTPVQAGRPREDFARANPIKSDGEEEEGEEEGRGPGQATQPSWPPQLAKMGNTTTQTPGFGKTSPSGTGLRDQQEESRIGKAPRIIRRS